MSKSSTTSLHHTSPGSENPPTSYYYLQLQFKLEGNQTHHQAYNPTSKAKQNKDWGEINLLAENPKPKP